MAQPLSGSRYRTLGPFRAGWKVMGQIPQPSGRALNSAANSLANRPNIRDAVQLVVPNGAQPAVRRPGQIVSIRDSVPRGLFPGRVHSRGRSR